MKKLKILLFIFFLLNILLSNFLSAEIIISEAELNPSGKDNGAEWIELYSDNQINLENYKLINNDNNEINLTQIFQGYLIINFEKQWLDNSDEKIFLIDDNNEIIFETIIFEDSSDDDKTWNYCDEEWVFQEQTKNKKNQCDFDEGTEENIKESEPEQTESLETEEQVKETQDNIINKTSDNINSKKISINSDDIIRLSNLETYDKETEHIKTRNNILYQSKNELIKQYSIIGFAILCSVLCVLLALNKIN